MFPDAVCPVFPGEYGIAKLPYRRFLLWSAIGGTIWGVYTCALAYAVGTALEDFPLASVVISGAITTVLMGITLWTVRRNRKQRRGDVAASTQATVASADRRP